MAQRSQQIQQQKQVQRQNLSQLQVLFVRLLELPTEGLEERVHAEVLENPALEELHDTDIQIAPDEEYDELEKSEYNDDEGDEIGTAYTNEADEDTLAALGDYRTIDDIPDYTLGYSGVNANEQIEDIPFSAATSFHEILKEQLSEGNFTDHEREIAEYLIGSFDDDGLLRKDLSTITEELTIYHYMDTDITEVQRILHTIQDFDPAGIGAQNLQECLILQLKRKPDSTAKQTAMKILKKYYDDFSYKRWERIAQRMELTDEAFKEAINELVHLNPRPGNSLNEFMGKSMQQIIPDFTVKVDTEGNITFTLNDGNVPDLRISDSFSRMLQEYSQNNPNDRNNREAIMFLKQKIDSAQGFINVIEQRRHTLTITMQAIIKLQHLFFLEGDEQLLKPMLLKDVADLAGIDISTVSRVSNNKYVETAHGIYPLKFFFGDSYHKPAVVRNRQMQTTDTNSDKKDKGEDEEITLRQIRAIIQECIDEEDKQHPLNDDELTKKLKEKGFDLARRTVAKYRQQLGIPVARMRR